ncbi:hypothetical protein [Limnoglobus roseus]|nr:hypothetical protein [Limnoglobus roseus]
MHLEQSNPAMGWKANFMMISLGVLDTQGQRMFATTEDAEALDYETALKLRNLCFEANGLGQTESKKN